MWQNASARIDRLTIYFKGESEELNDSSRMEMESLLNEIECGTEIKWLELYSYAQYEESARAVRLSERRSRTICDLLQIEMDSLTIQNLGNVKCKLNFEVEGWNRVDLYYCRLGNDKKVRITNNELVDSTRQREIIVQLFFKGNSTDVREGSFPELKRIETVFKENPNLSAEIRGHVCCGNNIMLSRKRAREIYLYLIERGIDKSRLTYKGYGNKSPLVTPELSDQDRALNRRIEIVFTIPVTADDTFASNQD